MTFTPHKASVALYLAACALPIMTTGRSAPIAEFGWQAVLLGVFTLAETPAWLANPLWILGLLLTRRNVGLVGCCCSVAAVACGLSVLLLPGEWLVRHDWFGRRVVSLRPGAFVWLAALALPAGQSALAYFGPKADSAD